MFPKINSLILKNIEEKFNITRLKQIAANYTTKAFLFLQLSNSMHFFFKYPNDTIQHIKRYMNKHYNIYNLSFIILNTT